METSLFEQLDHIFNPTSVAMIGASDRFGSWGFGIMNRLLAQPGRKIYPVNEKAPEICGLRAYRNITEIPDEVEFAIIAIPTPGIPAVMKECVEKGVKAALIISGGLAESSEEGKRIEQEILKIAREGGLRFIGPNSMGHADTSSNFSTLSWIKNVAKGPIGFISQSGTYGHRISRIGMRAGIGFSKFINSGNEADLHLEDFLEYLARDIEPFLFSPEQKERILTFREYWQQHQ